MKPVFRDRTLKVSIAFDIAGVGQRRNASNSSSLRDVVTPHLRRLDGRQSYRVLSHRWRWDISFPVRYHGRPIGLHRLEGQNG
jgi:hypothetical protein